MPILVLLSILSTGCGLMRSINTNHEKNTEMTGLFSSGDEAVEKARKLVVGVTRCPEELKELGFDPDAPNVVRLPGAKGVHYILGTENPQINVSKPEDIQKISDEWNRYYVVVYPLKKPKFDKQAIYLNRQDLLTTGPNGEYFIVCRDEKVLSHNFGGQKHVYKPGENKKFGGNVLEYFVDLPRRALGLIGF